MPFSYEIKYWNESNMFENYGFVYGEDYLDAMKYLLEYYGTNEIVSVTLSLVTDELIVTDNKEAFKHFQEALF
jgi:hypothetical protein